MPNESIRAVLFDFGGVILSSPFEAFARYEEANGLPTDFLRGLNATNPDTNAWAQLERSEVPIDEFCRRYEAEAIAAGHTIDAAAVLSLLSGELRPEMVRALHRLKQDFRLALLTNNFVQMDGHVDRETEMSEVLALFDVIVESSKAGVRKPDPRFYEIALDALAIEPHEAVFLDDLGINLKPARALGITTIKVESGPQALTELGQVLGIDFDLS